jgi:histidinol-phosphate aminotransferase
VIAAARTTDTLVVVDEAYRSFASDSFFGDLPAHDNLLVLRTVSKSGLAGARLGYLVGSPAWLNEIDKVRPPYNVNAFTQVAVAFALEHADVLDAQARILRDQRGRLAEALADLPGIEVFASQANFILFRIVSDEATIATRTHAALKARGILVKDLSASHPLCARCLRVTVSTPDENAAFMTALKSSLP